MIKWFANFNFLSLWSWIKPDELSPIYDAIYFTSHFYLRKKVRKFSFKMLKTCWKVFHLCASFCAIFGFSPMGDHLKNLNRGCLYSWIIATTEAGTVDIVFVTDFDDATNSLWRWFSIYMEWESHVAVKWYGGVGWSVLLEKNWSGGFAMIFVIHVKDGIWEITVFHFACRCNKDQAWEWFSTIHRY